MTLSILTREPETGDIGFAVASRWPAVAAIVPYHRPGVGTVAVQAQANAVIARTALDALADGALPDEAIAQAVAQVPDDERQILVMTHDGDSAVWTGPLCAWHVAEARGDDCLAAGNKLAAPEVPQAMVETYSLTRGQLFGNRLLKALEAGVEAGGDKRGLEGAGVRVWPNRELLGDELPFDLRADEGPWPIRRIREAMRRKRALEVTVY
jgi:uncharacterized Ntn-hydrolase superfamily protein